MLPKYHCGNRWELLRLLPLFLSDELKQAGAQFLMQPDRVIWPDGTITKKRKALVLQANMAFMELL